MHINDIIFVKEMRRMEVVMAETQFVIFKLNDEEYGVNIKQVQEICSYQKATFVPNSPEFIQGIINLRNVVIPVINLKDRFRITNSDVVDENTRMIVMNISKGQFGFVVDDASEVISIDENNIEETPEMLMGDGRRYISGIGKVGDRLLVLLDMEQLLNEEEKGQIKSIK